MSSVGWMTVVRADDGSPGTMTADRPYDPAMERMTRAEAWRWLGEGNRPAVFASLREDGRPHAIPTWYAIDGDQLVFTTWHTTVKAANLRRDPRVPLVIQDPAPPYDKVSVEGEARLIDDLPQCRAISTLLGAKYMGADRAEEFGARNGVAVELVVRVRPIRMHGVRGVAD
jgi:PPOX class probable F420-dependent enzyme